jgi:hypothetical protein
MAFGLLERWGGWIPQRLRNTALRWGLGVALGLGTVVGAFAWRDTNLNDSIAIGIVSLAPFLGALLVVFALFERNSPRSIKVSTALLVLLLAAFISVPTVVPLHDEKLFGCLFFVLIWSVASIIAVLLHRKRLFDFATLVIGTRLVVVYFEVFGSLAATGVGLILSGVVILGTVFIWHRYRLVLSRFLPGGGR